MLPVVPLPVMSTPSPVLPLMTLRAAGVVPPMVLPEARQLRSARHCPDCPAATSLMRRCRSDCPGPRCRSKRRRKSPHPRLSYGDCVAEDAVVWHSGERDAVASIAEWVAVYVEDRLARRIGSDRFPCTMLPVAGAQTDAAVEVPGNDVRRASVAPPMVLPFAPPS